MRGKPRVSRRSVAAIALATAAVLGVSAVPASAGGPAPDERTADYETDFMKGMIDHHQMAIEMSEICLEKAVHQELRRKCEDIIGAQSAERNQMQSWLDDWYGIEYAPQMTAGEERKLDKLSSMNGADFEIAFMRSMIRHHSKAIREAETCLDRAYHEELRDLCSNIIETQSAEIELFERWLCDWYRRCQEVERRGAA